MKRLFLAGAHAGPCVVPEAAAHHLVDVLRMSEGDALEVFDGAGTTFPARIEQLDGETVMLALGEGRAAPALRRVTIVQGLPKGDKLDWVLQKGTELGASAFSIAICERTVVKVEGKEAHKVARWQRIVEEAARQCGRADVPPVQPPLALEAAVRALAPGTRVYVLDESERATTLSAAFLLAQPTDEVAVVIGPEGGLSRTEVDGLLTLHAVPVTLGRLVLRTETAALAALAVLRHLDGALG
jgi:16S rRNA (uracil1498-N3)-methyltransferase